MNTKYFEMNNENTLLARFNVLKYRRGDEVGSVPFHPFSYKEGSNEHGKEHEAGTQHGAV